jgi:riboflavin kinase/FMN adenylyltransferase
LKVYRGIQNFSPIKNAVVTIGTFDGVHLGHKKIIDRLRDFAFASEGETVVVTFQPHPRLVLFPDDNDLRLLNTDEEKMQLLEKAGVDHVAVIDFTREFSRLSSLEFVRDILVNKIGAKKLVIGYDHHFGRNREGSFEDLRELAPLYGFGVEEIPAQDIDHVAISSTKIRHALSEGDMSVANSFLGYSYSISGIVVKGNQRGRTIGFPTANIRVSDRFKLIPGNGVYAIKIKVKDRIHKGMLNIGIRPTVEGTELTIEAHIFNFSEDIYDQEVRMYFLERIRDEVKFANLEELKAQLQKDQEQAQLLMRTNEKEYVVF